MTQGSEQAAVELRIDWQANGVAHRNRQYFEKINFWRDIFPGGLSSSLPASNGGWVSEQFPAGELVPPWSASNIHTVGRSTLKLERKNGPPVQLHAGRHYPRYIAAGLADIHAGNMQPLRVIAIDGDKVTLDLNHALARAPLTVSARIDRRIDMTGEHGGHCLDAAQALIDTGAGMETFDPDDLVYLAGEHPFARLDERGDSLFYSQPRLVQHIDATAISQITGIYSDFLTNGMRVLDLMSSWVSHLPDDRDLAVTGLGMNEDELARNPQLVQGVRHDLNDDPRLPFPDNHFDAVVCTVSIEYLTDPASVMRETARILKPGGPFIVTFSDRWFPTKVIGIWNELHPFERMALVLEYFHMAGNFHELATASVRGFPRPADDKYADRLSLSDPVFAVSGRSRD
jgi:SAM-dependent methyltransferase